MKQWNQVFVDKMDCKSEFKPICIRCEKPISWGQPMKEIQHSEAWGDWKEYEHEHCEEYKKS